MNKLLILIFLIPILISAQVANKEVVINNAIVNSDTLDTFERIIISDQDSLILNYKLIDSLNENSPFLFKILLSNGIDTAISTINSPVIRYANLPESEYFIEISAYDGKLRWETSPKRIEFKVDNYIYSIIKEGEKLRNLNDSLDNVILGYKSSIEIDNYLTYLLILLILIIIILLILLSKKVKSQSKRIDGSMTENNIDLEKENAKLRKELSSLRMQIDRMQSNSEIITEQNKELRKQITTAMSSQKELEELQTQKDELFAMIIHDIKNPVALIKSLVDLLKSYDVQASDIQEILDDISSTSNKILSLSSEMCKIMTLEASVLELKFDTVNLNDIVTDVFRRNSVKANSKNQTYELLLGDDIPELPIDIKKMDEVVDNLLSNAIKFTESNGSILVETLVDENKLLLKVSDSGLGLSEDDIKKAFQRGAKLSARPTGDESSSGLGLWIVKKLVEAHHGYISIKSSKGKGSTFTVSLPIKKK